MEVRQWLTDNTNSVLCADQNIEDELRFDLLAMRFTCYDLDVSRVTSVDEMIRVIATSLPCDPDYFEVDPERKPNWDAIEDSLWGGLAVENARIGIFLHHTEGLVGSQLNLIFVFLSLLFKIAYSQELTLKVMLLGHGSNFIL